jgi:hypothetical protein
MMTTSNHCGLLAMHGSARPDGLAALAIAHRHGPMTLQDLRTKAQRCSQYIDYDYLDISHQTGGSRDDPAAK